jgi:hypothetical protein
VATFPGTAMWPPPEWTGGVAAPVDPLAALPPGSLGWPPPEWDAVDDQSMPLMPPPPEEPVPDAVWSMPVPPELAGGPPPSGPPAPMFARAEDTGRTSFPPAGWLAPDDQLVDDGEGLAELEQQQDEADADVERMADSEKTTADVEDDQAADAETARQAEIDRLAALDPATWAQIQGERQLRAERERQVQQRVLADEQLRAFEENDALQQKARAAAKADLEEVTTSAKRMADTSPFESWWSSRSTGQKATGYIAAILGGFLSKGTGGRNTAIDLFLKVADDDANAKWMKLRERRGLARDALGDAGEEFRTREAIRLASYEHGIRAIEAKMVNLDPEGDAMARLAGAKRELQDRQLAAMAHAGEEARKFRLDAFKADSDRMKAEADMLRAQAEAAKKLGAGGGGGGRSGKEKYTPAQLAEMLPPGSWIPPASSAPMTIGEYKARAEAGRTGRTVNDPTETEKREHELAVNGPGGKPLAKADGSKLLAQDKEQRQKMDAKMVAAREVAEIIDEVLFIRDSVGGESDTFNSDERQRLEVLQSRLAILMKSGTEGMSSDSDMQRIAAALGASDVASFRTRAAGLLEGRQRALSQFNKELETMGYDGTPVDFANKYKRPKAKRDPAADKLASQKGPDIEPPTGDKTAGEVLENAGPAAYGPDGELVPEVRAALRNAPDPLFDPAGARGISKTQNDGLEAMLQGVLTGDVAAARKLVAAANDAKLTPRARAAAVAEVGKLVASGNATMLKAIGGGD